MPKASVRGPIVTDDFGWMYEMLGMPCTTPSGFAGELDAAGGDPVVVEINSPGGFVEAATEIYEAIAGYPGDIECRVVGQAASCASFIACAAPNTISPMGWLFLHRCSGCFSGNRHDLASGVQALDSIDENIMGVYRAKSGLSDDDLYALMDAETTISAPMAVELGLVDAMTATPDRTEPRTAGADHVEPGEGRIAASAAGFVDPRNMDPALIAGLRALYEQDRKIGDRMSEPKTASRQRLSQLLNARRARAERDPEKDPAQDPEKDPEEDPADPEKEKPEEGGDAGKSPEEEDPDEGGHPADPDEDPATDPEEEDPDEGEDPEGDPGKKRASAFRRGVRAERARIAAILDIAAAVPAEMLDDALFGHPISAERLAVKAMSAASERTAGYAAAARRDASASGAERVAASAKGTPGTGASRTAALADAIRQKLR